MKIIITYFFRLLLIFIPAALVAQVSDHWETIIQPGSPCKYYVPDAPLPANWTDIDFYDAPWTSGTGGVGYGDDDDNSLIPDPSTSVYCRYSFTVNSVDAISALILEIDSIHPSISKAPCFRLW